MSSIRIGRNSRRISSLNSYDSVVNGDCRLRPAGRRHSEAVSRVQIDYKSKMISIELMVVRGKKTSSAREE
jgi:hypothetical protein